LIQSSKLHPLWWTPLLPVMFFVSSISIGLAMIIFESSMSSRYFGRGLEIHLLEKLGKAIPVALGIYAVLKFAELLRSGEAGLLFGGGLHSLLFWAEIVIGYSSRCCLPPCQPRPRTLLRRSSCCSE
jgi:Ni/Fe-hydrogenase subunit HybB-like protein